MRGRKFALYLLPTLFRQSVPNPNHPPTPHLKNRATYKAPTLQKGGGFAICVAVTLTGAYPA